MGKRREYEGVVLSDKMQKTIIVKVTRMSKHPKYGKITKKYSKFKAHDEKNTAKTGDTVRIVETRPLSKDKRYRLKAIAKKARSYAQINPVREFGPLTDSTDGGIKPPSARKSLKHRLKSVAFSNGIKDKTNDSAA